MKKNKKSQVYGLSGFIYAIAIAIILIVGLLGLSKEYDLKSAAGLYRFSSVMATKNAEIVKKLMDQERGYAIDKSLFITGAFGGYSPDVDLIPVKNCTLPGCDKCSSIGYICLGTSTNCSSSVCTNPNCALGYVCVEATGKCTNPSTHNVQTNWPGCTPIDYGKCAKSLDDYYRTKSAVLSPECYQNIKSETSTDTCGATKNDASYLGEKTVPYWRYLSLTCIPNSTFLINTTFTEFAGSRYVNPSELLSNALKVATGSDLSMQYKLRIDSVNETTGILETSWFVVMPGEGIKLSAPPPPDNPVVQYSFYPFMHIFSNTSFFNVYNESKTFVQSSELTKLMKGDLSPIPVVVDEDFKTADKDQYNNINTYPLPDMPRPFIALVNYSKSLPDSPNYCPDTQLDASLVSKTYEHNCTVYTERNDDGLLVVKDFGGYCNETGADHNIVDDDAIKCVMVRTINNINSQLKLGPNAGDSPAPHPSSLGWKYEFKTFNLTFKGAPTPGSTAPYISEYVYNTTTPNVFYPHICLSPCNVAATCVGPAPFNNGYQYCTSGSSTPIITGNVTSTPVCNSRTSGTTDIIINAKANATAGLYASNCQAAVNVVMSAQNYSSSGCPASASNSSEETFILRQANPIAYASRTISNYDSSCAGTKTIFTILNSFAQITYPNYIYTPPAAGGSTNLSYCEENINYNASVPPTTDKLHQGGFNCASKQDCILGMNCTSNNVCAPCGAQPPQHCCIGNICNSGMVCRNDFCSVCGQSNQPCCSAGTACSNTNGTCNDTIGSTAGFCKTCIGLGAPCCPGNVCVGNWLKCNTSATPVSECSNCGDFGQTCCSSDTNKCKSGYLCNTSTICSCGLLNEPCCSGNQCSGNLVCLGGTCYEGDVCGNNRGRSVWTIAQQNTPCTGKTSGTDDCCCCFVTQHVLDLNTIYDHKFVEVFFSFAPRGSSKTYSVTIENSTDAQHWTTLGIVSTYYNCNSGNFDCNNGKDDIIRNYGIGSNFRYIRLTATTPDGYIDSPYVKITGHCSTFTCTADSSCCNLNCDETAGLCR